MLNLLILVTKNIISTKSMLHEPYYYIKDRKRETETERERERKRETIRREKEYIAFL